MGFTKKQRREQRKHQFTPAHKVKKQRAPRGVPTEQPISREQRDAPARAMVLVRTAWSEAGEELHEVFRLVELPAGKDQEQLRQDILARLQAPGRKNCVVELFDPDNVPPGTIPANAQITFGEPSFND